MTGHRDTTANKAIRAADRTSRRTFHAYWCRVDGGTRVHGRGGFWCPRCAELNGDRELELLVELDKYAGGGGR